MNDVRVRFLSQELNLRAIAATTTDIVSEAQRLHRCSPTATAALGRCLTGAALLGASLKTGHTLTLRIQGGGPSGTIIAMCEADGVVRGYIQFPEADVPPTESGKLDVASLVGADGFLSVAYDLGMKEPYSGSSELISGEIAMDLAYYLTTSEQIPSSTGLGVLVGTEGQVLAAGGFLVQVLPLDPRTPEDIVQAREEAITTIIQQSQDLDSVSHMIEEGATATDVVHYIMGGVPMNKVSEEGIIFRCTCNRSRVMNVLRAMEPTELELMARGTTPAEVTCEFCRETYYFEPEELSEILKGMNETQ